MVFKFELIKFPFQSEIKKLSPLPGFESGTSPVASPIITIELWRLDKLTSILRHWKVLFQMMAFKKSIVLRTSQYFSAKQQELEHLETKFWNAFWGAKVWLWHWFYWITIVSIIYRVLYVFLVSNWHALSKLLTDCCWVCIPI